MRTARTPAILLVLLYAGFLAVWVWSGTQLPARVATHFDAAGQPDGWMSRAAHQKLMLVFGFGFPLFLAAVFYLIRFLPAWSINIPHRNYWLAPERRGDTADFLATHGLWLACLATLFVTGILYSVVQANRQVPPSLSLTGFLAVLTPFMGGMAIWLVMLLRHFRRPP